MPELVSFLTLAALALAVIAALTAIRLLFRVVERLMISSGGTGPRVLSWEDELRIDRTVRHWKTGVLVVFATALPIPFSHRIASIPVMQQMATAFFGAHGAIKLGVVVSAVLAIGTAVIVGRYIRTVAERGEL